MEWVQLAVLIYAAYELLLSIKEAAETLIDLMLSTLSPHHVFHWSTSVNTYKAVKPLSLSRYMIENHQNFRRFLLECYFVTYSTLRWHQANFFQAPEAHKSFTWSCDPRILHAWGIDSSNPLPWQVMQYLLFEVSAWWHLWKGVVVVSPRPDGEYMPPVMASLWLVSPLVTLHSLIQPGISWELWVLVKETFVLLSKF